MRRASRYLAAVNGLALLCVIATGWLHHAGSVAALHRWLPHGLLILDWTAIPMAIGVAAARPGGRPFAVVARVMGLLILWGDVLLATATGYLGPSHGRSDEMTFRRFQVLHCWVWPMLGIALVVWWYRKPTASDNALQYGTSEL